MIAAGKLGQSVTRAGRRSVFELDLKSNGTVNDSSAVCKFIEIWDLCTMHINVSVSTSLRPREP